MKEDTREIRELKDRFAVNDVVAGLERLSAMLTVFGTYASWNACESDDSVVTPQQMNLAYDMMSDYAGMLGERLMEVGERMMDIKISD